MNVRFLVLAAAVTLMGTSAAAKSYITAHELLGLSEKVSLKGFKYTFGKHGEIIPTAGIVSAVPNPDELVLYGKWHIKLGGINAPIADKPQRKGDYYGKGGLELAQKFKGKLVSIEYQDFLQDKKGNLYGYIKSSDGAYLNADLIEKGYALASCQPPLTKDCSIFLDLQKKALKQKIGMWNFEENKQTDVVRPKITVEAYIQRAVDGDGLITDDGNTIRYIGIDAPEGDEMEHAGTIAQEAFLMNDSLVNGDIVKLEYDVQESDPRGRDLAYVYVHRDGKDVMVNELLVEAGLAWVAIFPPNVKRIGELLAAQQRAVDAKRGIWKTD